MKVSALRFCQNLFEHASGPYQLPAWTKWNVESWLTWILTRNMVRGKARDILAGASARCQRALAHSWSSSSWAISGGREKSAGVTRGSGILTRCAKMNARSWWI